MDYSGRADQREAQYIFDLGFAPCRDPAEDEMGWKAAPVLDLQPVHFLGAGTLKAPLCRWA